MVQSVGGYVKAAERPARRRSRSRSVESSSVIEDKVQALEKRPCSGEDHSQRTKQKEPKSDKILNGEGDHFWSLAGISSLTSKKPNKKPKKAEKGNISSEGRAETSLEDSMGDVSSKASKEGRKVKPKKDNNGSNKLDHSAATISSSETRDTSQEGSHRISRTTKKKTSDSKKKNSRSVSVKRRDPSASERSERTTRKSVSKKKTSKSKSPKRRRASTASPKPKQLPPETYRNASPKKTKQRIINRAISSPTLRSPVECGKKKIGNVRSSQSPSPRSSPSNNSEQGDKSPGKKRSPWKQVEVSPPAGVTRKSKRNFLPLPGPPLSTTSTDVSEREIGSKRTNTLKIDGQGPPSVPQRKCSGSPPPKRLINRAVSSPGLATQSKTTPKGAPPRNLATVTYTPQKKHNAVPPPPKKPALNRALSSPVLTSPTKKRASPSPARYDRPLSGRLSAVTACVTAMIADKKEDGRPTKHKPVFRRGLLQKSSSRRLRLKRSSSSDDAAVRKPMGSTAIEVEPIRTISLFPKNGRQLNRNLSAGSLQAELSSSGRPAPEARGVKRHSSAPMTSSNHNPISLEVKGGILRSISEDESDHASPVPKKRRPVIMRPSPSPLVGTKSEMLSIRSLQNVIDEGDPHPKSTSLPNKRAGYTRTQSVPILIEKGKNLLLRGGPTYVDSASTEFSASSDRKIIRARSGDVSSLARSVHGNPAEIKRRKSFDDVKRPKPQGILRTSSHHNSNSGSGSNSPPPTLRESSMDRPMKNFVTDVGFASSADVYYASSDNENDFSVEEETIQFEPKPKITPLSSRPGLKRSSSSRSGLNLSIHSFMTTRSSLSVDKDEFEDDPQRKQLLRYLRLLPPHKDEKPLKRNIRIFTWLVLLFDFIAAMVAVTTYDGATTCCGEPIFSLLINLNWDVLFRVITYLYLVLIFAEVIPIVRQGLPFNILNPTLGFAITFGMFFQDSVGEAVAMWILEATAIFFEFMIYRTKKKIYCDEMARLEKTDTELAELSKSRRASKRWSRSKFIGGAGSTHGSQHSLPFSAIEEREDDDDSSVSGDSFGGNDSSQDLEERDPEDPSEIANAAFSTRDSEPGTLKNLSREASASKNSPSTAKTVDLMELSGHASLASTASRVPKVGERREMRLLRERRILRQKKQSEARELKIHFIGTCINFGLIVISLILIITISGTGGLCIFDGKVKIFSMDQLGKCNQCRRGSDVCEVCNADGSHQCYYPYY